MNRRTLPKSIELNNVEVPIDADFRNILDIFEIFNDPDLLNQEKTMLALSYFYETDEYFSDLENAVINMMEFLSGGSIDTSNETQSSEQPPLYSWEQDFNIIIAPVNKVIGYDVRGVEFLHWWTFLSAFMEIGECTFSTFVSIRDKLNRGIKLDKAEERIYKNNRDKIILTKKYDSTTQALMDEIMGKEV